MPAGLNEGKYSNVVLFVGQGCKKTFFMQSIRFSKEKSR